MSTEHIHILRPHCHLQARARTCTTLLYQAAAVPVRKKTWAVDMSGGGHSTAKTKIGNGPAPKRGFADLP